MNKKFDEFYFSCGIQRDLTPPYSPQQNNIDERKNITVIEKPRAMFQAFNMLKFSWTKA